MNLETTIQITPDLSSALAGLKPEPMLKAVALGMKRGTLMIAAEIQKTRLSGKGPFAPSLKKLGVDTGRLRQSVRGTAPQINGTTVTTSIGSNVSYAAAHEFGFKGSVNVKRHEVTMKALFGRKLKSPLRFSRLASKRNVNIPERRPFRTGIEENIHMVENEITRAITTRSKS